MRKRVRSGHLKTAEDMSMPVAMHLPGFSVEDLTSLSLKPLACTFVEYAALAADAAASQTKEMQRGIEAAEKRATDAERGVEAAEKRAKAAEKRATDAERGVEAAEQRINSLQQKQLEMQKLFDAVADSNARGLALAKQCRVEQARYKQVEEKYTELSTRHEKAMKRQQQAEVEYTELSTRHEKAQDDQSQAAEKIASALASLQKLHN